MKPGHGEVMDIQSERLDLHGCVEVIRALLETVRHSGSDYFNSTPVVTLSDRYELDGGTAVRCGASPAGEGEWTGTEPGCTAPPAVCEADTCAATGTPMK